MAAHQRRHSPPHRDSAGNAAPFGFAHDRLIPACIASIDIPVGRHQPAGRGRLLGLDYSQSISHSCVDTVFPQSAGYHPWRRYRLNELCGQSPGAAARPCLTGL